MLPSGPGRRPPPTRRNYRAVGGEAVMSHKRASRRSVFRKAQETGDCYEAAFQHMMSDAMRSGIGNMATDLKLVHAEVAGQGPLDGIRYGHAFVLDGNTVIDKSNGRNLVMPASKYFMLGDIKKAPSKYFEYSWKEVQKKAVTTGHYGPWDLNTEY